MAPENAANTPQTPTSAKSSRVERTRTDGRDGRAPGLATTGAPTTAAPKRCSGSGAFATAAPGEAVECLTCHRRIGVARGRIVAHNSTGAHALIVKAISPEELAIMRAEWAEEDRRGH